MHIAHLDTTNRAYAPDEKRDKRLLLHKKEIRKLEEKIKQGGLSVVPLKLYFNNRNLAKLEIALARGLKKYDKREAIKKREVDRKIKQAIKEYDKVLSIDVARQNLKKLPRKLKRLNKIVSCNLLGNEFKSFPTVLTKLSTLDEISLSSNKLATVTSKIGQLKNLRILILNNNRLTELPKEIGELTNLLYLEIGNNQLTTLPDEIKYLTSLQELHIERNKLSETEKERIKRLLPGCVIHF